MKSPHALLNSNNGRTMPTYTPRNSTEDRFKDCSPSYRTRVPKELPFAPSNTCTLSHHHPKCWMTNVLRISRKGSSVRPSVHPSERHDIQDSRFFVAQRNDYTKFHMISTPPTPPSTRLSVYETLPWCLSHPATVVQIVANWSLNWIHIDSK